MVVGGHREGGGCYRSPDSIKNLRFCVRYRRIEDVFALDTEEDKFEEVMLSWQEKLFSRAEFERYRQQTDGAPGGPPAATQQSQADKHYRDVVRHMSPPRDTTISTLVDRDEPLEHSLCQSKLEEVRFHRHRQLQQAAAEDAFGRPGRPQLRPSVGRAPQHGALSGTAATSSDTVGSRQTSWVGRLRSWLATSTQVGGDDFQGAPAMYQVMQVVVNSEPQPRKPQRQRERERRRPRQQKQRQRRKDRTRERNEDDERSDAEGGDDGNEGKHSDASNDDDDDDDDDDGDSSEGESGDEEEAEHDRDASGALKAVRGPPVVLCTLIYEGNGRLAVVPDFSDQGAATPYRVKAGDGTLFHYTLHHVSEDISFEEQVQERAFAREWRQHTAHNLRTQIGYVFEKPPPGTARYHIGVEITATRCFGGGDFCVIAAANLKGNSSGPRASGADDHSDRHDEDDDYLTFRTQRATTHKGVAHYGMCFDLETTVEQAAASKTATLGNLYLQTNSFDWFGCRRVEGYACFPLPAVCGTYPQTLRMWRPKGTLQQERACFFLGGGIELEDDTFLRHPGSQTQGKRAAYTVVKPNVVGSTSGEILLRVHVLRISPT